MSVVWLQAWGDGDGNLGWTPAIENQPSEGLEQESAVGAAQEGVGHDVVMLPSSPRVELLLHEFPAPLASTVQSIEELVGLGLGRQLILVPLDEFQMKFGVELFEDGHE